MARRSMHHERQIASAAVGTDLVTRPFLADPVSVAVRCPTPIVRRAIEASFTDLADGADTDPVEIEVRQEESGGLSVAVDGETRFTSRNPNQALGAVVTSVTRIALDGDTERLHLHAAALSKGGRGVLLSASSGTGKTTLAAKLVTRGWAYGSDESVALGLGDTTVSTFPKPLMIKRGATGPVQELAAVRVALDPLDDEIWTVPASALGAEIVHTIHPACLVVLTPGQGRPGVGPSQPAAIHPVDAVVAMMQQTMDPRRFGPRAVELLAAIAAGSRCVEMQVGPLDAAADSLEQLLSDPPAMLPVQVLEPAPAVGLPWHVADRVRSVRIGDRAVIHDPARGPITALDEAGTAVWCTLLGQAPEGWGPEVLGAPAMRAFLEQLIGLGFLHASDARAEPA